MGMRRLFFVMAMACALFFQSSPSMALDVMQFYHSRDCGFGCGSSLTITSERVAYLYIGGNASAGYPMPYGIGFYEEKISGSIYATIKAAFLDKRFRDAEETTTTVLDGIYRNMRYTIDGKSVSKTFQTRPSERHMIRLEALLDEVRDTLLQYRPRVGLTVTTDDPMPLPDKGLVQVTMHITNTGTETCTFSPTQGGTEYLSLGAYLYVLIVNAMRLITLSPAENLKKLTLGPEESAAIIFQGAFDQAADALVSLSFSASLHVVSVGLESPDGVELRYEGGKDFRKQ